MCSHWQENKLKQSNEVLVEEGLGISTNFLSHVKAPPAASECATPVLQVCVSNTLDQNHRTTGKWLVCGSSRSFVRCICIVNCCCDTLSDKQLGLRPLIEDRTLCCGVCHHSSSPPTASSIWQRERFLKRIV